MEKTRNAFFLGATAGMSVMFIATIIFVKPEEPARQPDGPIGSNQPIAITPGHSASIESSINNSNILKESVIIRGQNINLTGQGKWVVVENCENLNIEVKEGGDKQFIRCEKIK